jgi:signal peptidase
MIWKGLGVVLNNESPVVVVLRYQNCSLQLIFSESMSPAFERGDILFLSMFRSSPIVAGEIVVFSIKGRDIPIVHRVLKIHERYL